MKCKTCVEDLEWATCLENNMHALENNLLYKIGQSNVNNKPVTNSMTGEWWPSIKEAARAIGRNYTVVREMLNGRRKKTLPLEYCDAC